jgi:hypothetical protein
VKGVFGLVLFYIITLVVLSGVSTVLSTIFVLGVVRPTTGTLMDAVSIQLSADVPKRYDDCATRITEGTCTYDLAATALSSELITHTPFTMGGVTFQAPNGTYGNVEFHGQAWGLSLIQQVSPMTYYFTLHKWRIHQSSATK